jgi:hypothetical protein
MNESQQSQSHAGSSAPAKREWAILVYRIPSHPTRLRAHIWRKLRRCGAVYLQQSVCLLPATSELTENLLWMAEEIEGMGGEATVLRGLCLSPRAEVRLVGHFRRATGAEYGRLAREAEALRRRARGLTGLDDVETAEEALKRLRTAFLRLKARTHFADPAEGRVEAALDAARLALERSGRKVATRRR